MSIVVGWLLGLLTLGQWSDLGYVKGIVGGEYYLIFTRPGRSSKLLLLLTVSGIYALGFGLLGLLPVPKPGRKVKGI